MRIARPSGMSLVVALLVLTLVCSHAHADARQPRMGIFTKAGARVDLSLPFVDSKGGRESLQSMVIPGRPFILVPIFYRCPRLCGLTISGVIELINRLPLVLGEDYSVIAYSFNPEDSPCDASARRSKMMDLISTRPNREDAVKFLVGSSENIAAINEQIGFRVRYADKELEHSSAIFVVSPDGAVRRYFAGVEFDPQKVGAALRAN